MIEFDQSFNHWTTEWSDDWRRRPGQVDRFGVWLIGWLKDLFSKLFWISNINFLTQNPQNHIVILCLHTFNPKTTCIKRALYLKQFQRIKNNDFLKSFAWKLEIKISVKAKQKIIQLSKNCCVICIDFCSQFEIVESCFWLETKTKIRETCFSLFCSQKNNKNLSLQIPMVWENACTRALPCNIFFAFVSNLYKFVQPLYNPSKSIHSISFLSCQYQIAVAHAKTVVNSKLHTHDCS